MRLAPCALAFLALAGMMACRDAAAPSNAVSVITISCEPGPCHASPDRLDTWPKSITVKSYKSWKCMIGTGTAILSCAERQNVPPGESAFFEFVDAEDSTRMVRIDVVDQAGGHTSALLPIAALALTLLALLLAGTVAWLVVEGEGVRQNQALSFQTAIQSLDHKIEAIIERTLNFQPPPAAKPTAAPEPATSGSGPGPAHATSPAWAEIEALRSEITRFVQFAKDCFVSLRNRSESAETKIRELEHLNGQLGRNMDVGTIRVTYRNLSRTVARIALRATDDDLIRHEKPNPSAEAALGSMLEVAGFSLLAPKQGERYSDGLHVSRSGSVAAQTKSQRGTIARVERRGLMDSNNEVIEKAEVVLYD